MERMGASVVAYDLSDEQEWDIVPYAEYDYRRHISQQKEHLRLLNNGFWLAHRAYNSRAKMAYGTVYELPDAIGQFDICTFGSILLHLRDPFLALQRVSSHVKETAIVTDLAPSLEDKQFYAGRRVIEFLPNARECRPTESWWKLTPQLVEEFLQVLGFAHTEVSFHRQLYRQQEIELYTVVGQRKGVTAFQAGNRREQSQSGLSDQDRSILEEMTLEGMDFSRIGKHLLRRGIRAIPKRLFNRS
jgi:hypothetical protein